MRRALGTLVLVLLMLAPAGARAERVVADLSSHLVAITTGFTGSDVLLFGAIESEQPGDIIVIVEGPPTDLIVRRKAQVAGIWVNQEGMDFEAMPAFYAVSASRNIDALLSPPDTRTYQIGTRWLRPANWDSLDPDQRGTFLDALIRSRERAGLYPPEQADVRFPGRRLFRTTIHFPANVPTGFYTVRVLLVRDGIVVSAQTTPLVVNKVGVSARVFDFAHENGWIYGVIAILAAAAAGWLAELILRQR